MKLSDMEWCFLNRTTDKVQFQARVPMNLHPNLLCKRIADTFISLMISIANKSPVIWRIALLFVVCIGQ